jgi:Ca-activated chloride channel homolog
VARHRGTRGSDGRALRRWLLFVLGALVSGIGALLGELARDAVTDGGRLHLGSWTPHLGPITLWLGVLLVALLSGAISEFVPGLLERAARRRPSGARRVRSRPWLFPVAGSVLAVGLAITAVVALVEPDPRPCVELRVGTSLGSTADQLARAYEATNPRVGGHCVHVTIRAAVSGVPKNEVLTGAYAEPNSELHVWWPSSSTFVRLFAAAGGADQIDHYEPLTASPQVIAMPASVADRLGWPDRRIGWDSLVTWMLDRDAWTGASGMTDPFRLARTDPNVSPSGLAMLTMTYASIAPGTGGVDPNRLLAPDVQAIVRRLESGVRQLGASSTPALDALRDDDEHGVPPGYTALCADEQAVIQYNLGVTPGAGAGPAKRPTDPLVAFYPDDGTVLADHPYVILKGALIDNDERAAAQGFLDYLKGPAGQRTLREAGFRDLSGAADPSLLVRGNGVLAQQPRPVQPNAGSLNAVLNTWQNVRSPVRSLLLAEASIRMSQPITAGGPRRRLDAAIDFGGGLVDQLRPDDTLGMWLYGRGLTGGQDYRQLVPMLPMGSPGQRDALGAATRGLGRQTGDAPGVDLYDAVLAARDALAATLGPGETGTLVLLAGGSGTGARITKVELIDRLRTPADPLAPRVRVVAVRIGPPTRRDDLTDIADATGGTVLDASATTQDEILAATVAAGNTAR